MIEINTIFENQSFNNPLKCSTLFKNCMITASKKNALTIKSNVFISVRWCKQINMFVGDNGTGLNRDKTGITLEQIKNSSLGMYNKIEKAYEILLSFINTSKEFYDIAEKHKIVQNKFKCFVFNVCLESNALFPVGIFVFVRSKKREGIDSIKNKNISVVNISISLIEKIYKLLPETFSMSHVIKICNLNKIKNVIQNQINKKENESLKHKKFNFKKDNFKYNYLKCKIKKERLLHYYIIQDISNSVLDVVSLEVDEVVDNLIVYDQNLQKFIKIKKVVYNKLDDINYESYIPILI